MNRGSVILLALALSGCGTVVDPHQTAGFTGAGGGSTTTSGTTGSSVSSSTSSSTGSTAPDVYEAVGLFTNVPRFAILKASPQRGLCFRVYVVAEGGGGGGLPGLSGTGVTVDSALVTHDAADCQLAAGPPPPPAGATSPVVSGMGSVSLTSPPECLVGIHAKLVLSGQPSWAPPSEPLDADALPILGGCP